MIAQHGRKLLWIILPNLGLGVWLWLVPDHVAFTATQVIVLLHVAVGLVTAPLLVLWLRAHVGGRWPRARDVNLPRLFAQYAVAILATLAFASGFWVIRSGQGMTPATIHAVLGLALIVPLAAHLLIDGHTRVAAVVIVILAAVIATPLIGRSAIPPLPVLPETPDFVSQTQPVNLYDTAAWCGDCHTDIFAEWRESTHGRAMQLPRVRADFERLIQANGVHFVDVDLHDDDETLRKSAQCIRCHGPTTFYGTDPTPPFTAGPPITDGVTCSFCHTLRGQHGHTTMAAPLYISAPQTVRRYLWQGSTNSVQRWIGDWLIRWRPEMHRNDYHVAFLETSDVCESCHSSQSASSFPTWQQSRFNDRDPNQRTTCQDCHMVREMTGKPRKEPGRLVPWGPVRPQRRTHLFAGGNVQAAIQLGDTTTAEWERAVSHRGMSLQLSEAHVDGEQLVARVSLKNDLVGHTFPAMEAKARGAFLKLSAVGRDGQVLVTSGERATPKLDKAAEIYRVPAGLSPMLWKQSDGAEEIDSTIRHDERFTYEMSLPLGEHAAEVEKVEAALIMQFDLDEPLSTSALAVHR